MRAKITPFRRLLLACCGLCLGPLAAIETGMARVNVIQELGRPVSAIARGDTEVMSYKDGVRITLKHGRVSEIVGLKTAETVPAEAAEVAKPEEEVVPAEPVLTKAEQETQARLEKEWADGQARARAEMEKSLTDLENMHTQPPTMPKAPAFNGLEFAVGLILKWLLTLAALKITCKYWGCEVFWSGLMTVAAVDVGVRTVIGLIGFLLLKMTSLFYTDEAVAAIIMVLVLRKVSINQSLAQAVQITMTTKVFSIVVGSFVFVMLMHVLH